MDNHIFNWDMAHIARSEDAERIQKKVLSNTLPLPWLSLGGQESRFSIHALQEELQNKDRIIVLLERNRQEIMGIVELFRAVSYAWLYYSKTIPHWGRSITLGIPEIIWSIITPCKEIGFPISGNNEVYYPRNIYTRKQLETVAWSTVDLYVARVHSI